MRYLGIDYGSKKVGLALSDEAGTMGFPHSIVLNTPKLADEICALVAKENVSAVVIGESKDFSGKENPIAKEAKAFGDTLALQAGVPVFYEMEILTSAQAKRTQQKEGKSRAPAARGPVDDSAAALILTSYLSHHDHHR
jgi:putative Holliday junction resolvase